MGSAPRILHLMLTMALGLVMIIAPLITVGTVVEQSVVQASNSTVDCARVIFAENLSPGDPLQPSGHVHNDSVGQPFVQLLGAFFVLERILAFDTFVSVGIHGPPDTVNISSLPVWLATLRLLI